jgi:hypothetical protein
MLKTLFRLVSALFLIAAVASGTIDSILSVASSSVVMTSLGNAWLGLDPESLTLAEFNADSYIGVDIWRPYVAPVLAQPAFAVFLVLALIFWIIGYRKPAEFGPSLH